MLSSGPACHRLCFLYLHSSAGAEPVLTWAGNLALVSMKEQDLLQPPLHGSAGCSLPLPLPVCLSHTPPDHASQAGSPYSLPLHACGLSKCFPGAVAASAQPVHKGKLPNSRDVSLKGSCRLRILALGVSAVALGLTGVCVCGAPGAAEAAGWKVPTGVPAPLPHAEACSPCICAAPSSG